VILTNANFVLMHFLSHGLRAPSGPEPFHNRGFTITLMWPRILALDLTATGISMLMHTTYIVHTHYTHLCIQGGIQNSP
jgi:hypothetical protein